MSHDEIWDAMHGVNQPKPASGEWTPEWLRRVITSHWDEPEREVICRLHNAALAAERAKIWREAPDQPDVQEAVIKKLDLVHRHALQKMAKMVADSLDELKSKTWAQLL